MSTKIHPSSKSKSKSRKEKRSQKRKKTQKKYDAQWESMPANVACAGKVGATCVGVGCVAGAAAGSCVISGGKKTKTLRKRKSMCTRLTNKECKQPRYKNRCKLTKSVNNGKFAKRSHCRIKKNKTRKIKQKK
jgi:hypothetical protein